MLRINFLTLGVCIFVCLLAGIIGSIFSVDAIPTWYTTLQKPPFNPPNWVFGPVWTTLYVLMGVSLYIIWVRKDTPKKHTALKFFYWQLVLNTSWSVVFFGLKSPILAFVVIVALLYFIIQTILHFKKISRNAAYLLYPYIAWVSFASILNLSIVLLNR